jgi:hypothetical protein
MREDIAAFEEDERTKQPTERDVTISTRIA